MQIGEESSVPEAHVVIQMTADDFIALVHNYTQVCETSALEATSTR